MDPITIFVAIKLFTLLAVTVLAITQAKRIAEWFQQHRPLEEFGRMGSEQELAERVRNKEFKTVQGVFDGAKEPNRIVKAFYNTKSENIAFHPVRAMETMSRPTSTMSKEMGSSFILKGYSNRSKLRSLSPLQQFLERLRLRRERSATGLIQTRSPRDRL